MSLYCITNGIVVLSSLVKSIPLIIHNPLVITLLCYSDVNWDWVDEETKEKIQQESKDDGEFWMSFKDFYRQFGEVTICLSGPDFDGDGVSDCVGKCVMSADPPENCHLTVKKLPKT